MIFNEFEFVFLFLPLVLAVFYMPGLARLRPYALLLASLVFYGISGTEHAVVLAIEILWVYGLTYSTRFAGSQALLILSILPPTLALIYYKYLGFLVRSVFGWEATTGGAFQLFESTLLPAGISFYTFNLVSFAVDRYRREVTPQPPLTRFALFITFFPHLVAGPILRFHDVSGAFTALPAFRLRREDASIAIGYVCIGLALKVLVADSLGRCIDPMAAAPGHLSPVAAAYVVAAYSFQIYFDFYGYSLCAIGLARLFGVRFPRNFDRPYEALNPREFWRRWHMTLSFWIRDYLYLPLGGNRRYIRNILIVFALCGLWHGAGWNFVAWGMYHGLLVVGYHAAAPMWDRLAPLAQRLGTFILVSLGWTLFLFDFSGARDLLASLAGLSDAAAADPLPLDWLMLGIASIVCVVIRPETIAEVRSRPGYGPSIAIAVLFVTTVLLFDRSQSFIYFRF